MKILNIDILNSSVISNFITAKIRNKNSKINQFSSNFTFTFNNVSKYVVFKCPSHTVLYYKYLLQFSNSLALQHKMSQDKYFGLKQDLKSEEICSDTMHL